MIDRASGVPVWRQVADDLRNRIGRGEWVAGARLPSEIDLAHDYGIGLGTLRKAYAALRAEGALVGGAPGIRASIPPKIQRRAVSLKPGEFVESRMPTPSERARFEIREGIPVLVVHSTDGVKIFPSDRYFVRAAWPANNGLANTN